ncbi:Ankyrin repeat domain-containing protein 40 [Bulinus truncatus]|nr:Ankyrin repeat domain-containing protein 40 [Bulinus truncatus]
MVKKDPQRHSHIMTALHWACKRNHGKVVQYLLEKGADKSVLNNEGLTPDQLTSNDEIRLMLGASPETPVKHVELPITANYLANPPFPYSSKETDSDFTNNTLSNTSNSLEGTVKIKSLDYPNEELVLKARIANSDEKDFIEIELGLSSLNFTSLLNLMCAELGVDKKLVAKIRKLPDTIIRKDKDIKRLRNYQELELVLTNKAMSSASRTYCLGPARNNETILY